jgi:NitT/TauT family transport system substrate-binding protein
MSAHDSAPIDRRKFLRYAGVGLGAAGLLGACSPSGGQGGQAGQSLRKITFLFDVTAYGKHGLFYTALDKGYWRENGLDVTIQSAQGSGDNVTKIGAKAADIGFADTGALILGRAKGANVKEVCMVHYRNLMMVVALKKFGINSPKDLEGKTFASTAADAGRVLLPIWAKINNFDDTKVNIITVDQAARPAPSSLARPRARWTSTRPTQPTSAPLGSRTRKSTRSCTPTTGWTSTTTGSSSTTTRCATTPTSCAAS